METDKLLTALYVIQKMVDPLFFIPTFFVTLYETIISLKRIQKFLTSKDNDHLQIEYLTENDNKKSPYAIEILHTDFGVDNNIDDDEEEDTDNNKNEKTNKNNISETLISNSNNSNDEKEEKIILLKDISVQIKKKEHIGIIGEVGSGKTCLLNAFINNLGVINKNGTKGNIKLSGKVSFVSQTPWILNATVENNIILFNKKDEEKI